MRGASAERIDLVRRQTEAWVRAQIGGDLRGAGFIDADLPRAQGGVCGFKLVPNLLPGQGFLSAGAAGKNRGQKQSAANGSNDPPHESSLPRLPTRAKVGDTSTLIFGFGHSHKDRK
jgi:hypothetical protein